MTTNSSNVSKPNSPPVPPIASWNSFVDCPAPWPATAWIAWEHSLQSATRAHRDGADEETVVAALLHDIGDLLAPHNHSELAAAVLRPYVSERTYWVVRQHGLFQSYYYAHHMGGDRNARDRYIDHPWYQDAVDFCHRWDQSSFDPEYESLPLEFFEPMVRRIFAREPFSMGMGPIMSLDGKVALITGAGGMRGVGPATALKLASLGADVAVTDVRRPLDDLPPQEVRAEWQSIDSVAEEVRNLGRQALPIYADLSRSEDIERLVADTVNHYGRLDILVNNARAIIGRDKVPVTELDEAVWAALPRYQHTPPCSCVPSSRAGRWSAWATEAAWSTSPATPASRPARTAPPTLPASSPLSA